MIRRSVAGCVVALSGLLAACGEPPEGPLAGTSQAITGGQVESGYPAVGQVISTSGGLCTGTLIFPSSVLTAKHCGTPSYFIDSSGVNHPIDRTAAWFPSDSAASTHDLQVAHLTAPILSFRPVDLYNTQPTVNQTCIAVGYGQDANGNAGVKRSATVVVDQVGSIQINILDLILVGANIAAGIRVHAGSGLPQHGDSGGPLFCNGQLVGVAVGLPEPGGNVDNNHVWYTALTDVQAGNQIDSTAWIANVTSDDLAAPLVSAITGGPNTMDLFIRGTDGQVWHKWSTGSAWGPSTFDWQPLGGVINGTPEAVTWGGDRIDVFVFGLDNGLWQLYWNGSQWTWNQLGGGPFIGHPTAVSWAPNRLAVFAVGTDGNVYYLFWNGSSFSNWAVYSFFDRSPVGFAGPIKAVVLPFNGANYVDVFAVGTDHVLYDAANFFDDSGPGDSSWEYLGGNVVGAPSMVSWGPNRLDVFTKQSDNGIYHKAWDSTLAVASDGGYWHPSTMGAWEPQAGSMANAPAVSSYRANQLTIIATGNGTDGLDYKAWFGAGWVPSQSTWFALGTNPVGTPTLLPFPSAGTIDMFTVGPNFTPYLMQYSTTGPSASMGWYPPASLGGVLAAY